jgi:hypothetical protein
VVRVNQERHQAILKKFDAFIEAIINRQTLTENVLPDVSGVRLSPEAASVLENLMAFVPPPLAQIARLKVIHGAAQIIAQEEGEECGASGAVETRAVVLAFWMGTPEPSREPLRKALDQMGLWQHIEAAGAV